MESESTMPLSNDLADDSGPEALSPHEAMKRSKNAELRKQKREEYIENTTARTCLGCESEFRSEGIHNRLCGRCRNRR